MISAARVVRDAAYLSVYEYFALYDLRAYVLTWIPRIALEALFLALVAEFIGGRPLLLFALVGFSGYRALHSTVSFATASVTSELFSGTMPLLVAAPTNPIVVLTGRNLAWTVHGLSTGVLTLVVAALLGLSLSVGAAVGALLALLIVEFSAYALSLVVGSVLLRYPSMGLVIGNLVGFVAFAISGVTTPINSLPEPVQALALALPLAHGLLALRELVGSANPSVYGPLLSSELLIGLVYLVAAVVSFRLFLNSARAGGGLDYQ